MRPELFQIPFPWAEKGYIPIFSYGFMIMLGFICSIAYGAWRARREGEDPNHVLDIGLYAVVSGILGARLFYYVEFYGEHFADRPWHVILHIWEGGLVFYGGLLAATAVILTYLRVKGLSVLKHADILAAAVPVGISFARIGCMLNGCCWGRVDRTGGALLSLTFPRGSPAWQYHVDHGWIPSSLASSLPVHATQLYEWGGTLLLAAILFFVYRYHRRHGQVFAMLWALYGLLRYVIESFRDHHVAERMIGWGIFWDPIAADYMTKSQVVSIVAALVGLALLIGLTKKGERYEPRS